MRATEHAPRGRFYLLERIYGLAEIVGRGAGEAEGVLEEIAEKWQRPMDYGKSRTHPQTAQVLKDLATVQNMIAGGRAEMRPRDHRLE